MPGKIPATVYGYRITHYKNLPFILQNGIYCPASDHADGDYINIGNKDIINKRGNKPIIHPPYGYIHDYVSFYFGPKSPMLYAISKGSSDTDCTQEEIVYLITSIPDIHKAGIPFVFTSGQALMELSVQYNDTRNLDKIDWDIIYSKYWFDRPPEYVDRVRKRMAELLVYKHLPINCILAVVVLNNKVKETVEKFIADAGLLIPVHTKSDWYY
jgi:hypothetical protein